MVRVKDKFLKHFFQGDARTVKVKKNVYLSFFLKGISVLISFLLIAITLRYLNQYKFGLWLTISSVISWINFFDIGLSNGLRNKLTESLAEEKYLLAKEYVSTTYFMMILVVFFLLILFFLLSIFIDWYSLFNLSKEFNENINLIVFVIFVFFSIRFILNIITVILLANQYPAKSNLITVISDFVTLCSVFLLTKFSSGSLLYISIIYSVIPIIILFIASLVLFNSKYSYLKPSINSIKLTKYKNLLNTGFNFFIIQMAVLIIFSTDNLIITKLLSPKEVTPYNIAYKYFGIVTMVFSIIVTPLWSAITDAYTKNDINWIKKSMKGITKIWGVLIFVTILLLIFSNLFYALWVGKDLIIPFKLSCLMAFYVVLASWNNIFAFFINGVNKIKLQTYYSVLAMLINIPLSIFFVKNLNTGSLGVILATCISLSLGAIIGPIQYKKIIRGSARGIWNK